MRLRRCARAVLYFAAKIQPWGVALFRFYDDPLRYFPQMAAAGGIAVGGVVGWGAALDTGDLFRFAGTLFFLAITVPLYAWKFHLAKKRQ
jgi:hypothetical protein